jgi:hypothetical protein
LGGSFEQVVRDAGRSLPRRHTIETPPDAPPPSHGRSLLRSAPAVVLFAIVLADAMRSADTDFWAHIYFGRLVLSQHQFLFHAPFSYACSPGPRNWILHDWLGTVVMTLVYDACGIIGLKLAKFTCVGAVMVLLSLGAAGTRASLAVQAIVFSVAAIALVPLMQFRTFLADDIFLAALMAMLARESYGRRVPLWLAVPMLALWTNLHGGFFVGLAAMGLYTAVRGAQDLAQGNGIRGTVKLAALTSAAALATLINPYGLRDGIVIVEVVHNPFTLAYVPEFKSIFARMLDLYHQQVPLFTFVCALATMAALLLTFALTPRADDLALFAVAVFMTATALYAARNTALAVIACCIPLCRHAYLTWARLSRRAQPGEEAHPTWTRPVFQALLALGALGLAIRTGLLSNRLPAARVKPVGALTFMRQHHLHGNTFCAFAWADYLIWHDAPLSKIFIESLFEAYYPATVQNDYFAFEVGSPRAAEVLTAYPHDFILFPTESPPSRFMTTREDWKLIYRDPVSSLFARADSPAARIAGVPVLSATAPQSFFP